MVRDVELAIPEVARFAQPTVVPKGDLETVAEDAEPALTDAADGLAVLLDEEGVMEGQDLLHDARDLVVLGVHEVARMEHPVQIE
ncbi:hypothetical protein [Streptomyces incarnatus]|uniref:hypothetical protein n=1 Tax=Streptomyces incarnatus TaxID=665007 RepID=UPI001AD81C02|nr:hypothetical protein [Streptomyces incarnatus]